MRSIRFHALVIVATALTAASSDAQTISGIGPAGEILKLHGDLQFTEGPTGDSRGNLYFTDIPANRIYKRSVGGELSVFLQPSGFCNGLMLHGDNTLYACSMDGRVIRVAIDGARVETVTESFEGKRFNAPNDLVLDSAGGLYFTDPHYRAPTPLPQGQTAVYYVAADGTVSRRVTGLKAPNGIILSPDEKTLYVIPSMQKEMYSYPVVEPGKLGEGKVFCTLQQPPESRGSGSGGDGLTIDTKGNLYITTGLGVQVFNPDGKHLGTIEFPEKPANATFGGVDRKTLYVTARTSLYAVKMESTGHVFPGKTD